MRINKLIFGENPYKKSNEKICKAIDHPLPEQEILRSNAKFIQKIIYNNEPKSTHKHILKPKRSTSRIYHGFPKNKLYRTPLEHHIALYNQLKEVKYEKPKTFAKKLKKMKVEYTPED